MRKAGSKGPSIFFLHGFGSNEQDLFSFSPYLNEDVTIISLRAPISLYPNSFAWYNIYYSGSVKSYDKEAAKLIKDKLINEMDYFINKYDCDLNRITLIGFSQGAIISYKLALLYPSKFEGIFIHSARLPVEYSVKEPSLYKNLNILIIHGSEDSGLSTKWAYQGKALFEKLGANTDYYEAKIGHEMNEITYSKIKQWLFSLVDE